MCNSVVCGIFTELCNHHHYLNPEHSHCPKQIHMPLGSHFLFPCPPQAWQSLSYFLALPIGLCLFWTFCQDRIIYNRCPFMSGLFYVWHVFEAHPCCSMYLYFIPFLKIFHCMDRSYFLYQFDGYGHLGCFYLSVTMNRTARVFLCKHLCGHQFLILWLYSSEWNCWPSGTRTELRSPWLVCKAETPFHNASDDTGGLQSFCIPAKTCYCLANFYLRDGNLITT